MPWIRGIAWDRTELEKADSSGEGHWLSRQAAVAGYMFWRDCSSSLAGDRLAEIEMGSSLENISGDPRSTGSRRFS